jgi:hypothetical protein
VSADKRFCDLQGFIYSVAAREGELPALNLGEVFGCVIGVDCDTECFITKTVE